MNFCPPVCNWDTDMHCFGGYDPIGCPMPDYCAPAFYEGNDGFQCWGNCPITCPMDEFVCPGYVDEMGCAHGDYCTPEVWSNGCMGFCEASCDWNNGEHWCPGEIYDEENWCFAPSWCSTDPTCGGMYSRSEERVEAEKKAKKVKA